MQSLPAIFRRYKYRISAAVVVVIAIVFGISSYLEWHQVYYFGRVIEMNENIIVISDPKLHMQPIMLTDETIMKEGKRMIDQVAVGQDVIVITSKHINGEIEAEIVRVVDGTRTSAEK